MIRTSNWREMTDRYLLEDARLDPIVTLNMKENWVEFSLRYVVDYKQRRITKDAICVQALRAIEQSDGEIKLGATSFEVTAVPPLDVNSRNKE